MPTRLAIAVTCWALLACGAPPREAAPLPTEPVGGPAPTDMKVTPRGLQMEFGPGVGRSQALRFAWGCWFVDSKNPRVGGLTCPIEIDELHIDVAEGPYGVTLMLRLGDPVAQEALQTWYETRP